MNGCRNFRRLAAALAVALCAAFQVQAQSPPPTINPQNGTPPGLQIPSLGANQNIAAVTSGINIPNGFSLVINGTFQPAAFQNVVWQNTAASQTQTFFVEGGITSLSASQITVQIPPNLFQSPVNAPQTVIISVNETGFPAATATLTLNPPLQSPPNGFVLTAGTVGVAYSQPLAQGGSGPYTVTLSSGSLPPGLPITPGSLSLAGTPTAAGIYNWSVSITEAWGTSVTLYEGNEIVNQPGQTAPLTPATLPAGSPGFTITLNGSNFVDVGLVGEISVPGTLVQWTAPLSSGPTPLVTTFVSANQLTANVPQNLLIVPGTASVAALQPSGAVTSGLPFLIASPSILSLGTPVLTARSTPVTLVVNGANFTQNGQETPVQSTILLSGSQTATTFLSGSALSSAHTFNTPGVIPVQVMNPGGAVSNIFNLTVVAAPTLSSLTPASAGIGSSLTLTVTGTNFSSTMQIVVAGQALPTTFLNANTLSAAVPSRLTGTGTAVPVTVVTADNYSPPPLSLTITPLQILNSSLPSGTYGSSYLAQLTAGGGVAPYLWSATGLQGLAINRSTGAITGTITTQGSMSVTVTVTDANGLIATASFTLNVITIPLQITTPNSLPVGTVAVPYSASLSAYGGSGNYSFSVVGGSLPPGLTLGSGGAISGTPTTYGTYSFTVQVSDSPLVGSAIFSIQIKPAPLTVTGPSTIANVVVGSAISLKFGASGGVPPYSFNFSGNLPGGGSLGRDGSLTGTATSTGTFSFTIYAIDSQGTQAAKGFSLTVIVSPLSITGSLGDGQVGVAYSGRVSASGGQPPYNLTLSGLPGGLGSSGGIVSGTPTTAGAYSVTASATDGAGAQATQTFTINIAAGALTIAGSLGNGTVGVAYSGSLSASGGSAPYTFSFSGLPAGITGSSSGSVSGTPTAAGSSTVKASVTDSKGLTAGATFTVTITVPPLTITSASVSNATVGSAVSATFTASGGVPPYTWSSSGLPAGLSLSGGGALSGTPTAPGTPSFTVTVTDSAGTTATKTVNLTVALPPAPTLNVTGLPSTSNPGTQSTVQIGIANVYPVDVTVTLTLTFAADSGPDDPTVQFSTGGRTATLTIPAGALSALTTVGVQTGTVAGTATVTARLTASSQDVTPTPAPVRTVRINAAAPTATSVTAAISGSGFTVTIVGYSTTRSVTSAIFTFTPAAGANLQTTSITIPADQLFQAWYQSSSSTTFGSQFTFTQPFNVQGGVTSIVSVTVTLVNAVGSSTAVTATLH